MVLRICLKDEAKVVLARLNQARRRIYLALATALAQSFSLKITGVFIPGKAKGKEEEDG